VQAFAYGYAVNTFYENWPSEASIDVNNTMIYPGFNWYINSGFPNLYQGTSSEFTPLAEVGPMSSSLYSVASNLLFITNPTNSWQSINSCVWNGSALTGRSFGGGFYADVEMKYGPPGGSQAESNPAWWFLPAEFLNGSITTTPFIELDGWESTYGMYTHEWNVSTGENNTVNLFGNTTPYQDNNIHHYSILWVPQANNGAKGYGFITRYIDGAPVGTLTYSTTAETNPAMTNNYVGAMSKIDGFHFCMFLSTAETWPAYYGTAQVWQHP
jgi:hypothetical protein